PPPTPPTPDRPFAVQQEAASHRSARAPFFAQLLAKPPARSLFFLLARWNAHHTQRLAMPGKIFTQPPAHHRRIPFVIYLPFAPLVPILRRDLIHLLSHL